MTQKLDNNLNKKTKMEHSITTPKMFLCKPKVHHRLKRESEESEGS